MYQHLELWQIIVMPVAIVTLCLVVNRFMFKSRNGVYGSGVRDRVFEIVVKQALVGTDWKKICAGPMQENNISAEEVEAEVQRRQSSK